MEPLRRWSDYIIDTTDTDSNALQQQIRDRFGGSRAPYLHIMSFGFARGLPRNADSVFDVRFLKNPHWEDALRPLTGLDKRSEEHTSELQSLMRISYAVFCLKKKKN